VASDTVVPHFTAIYRVETVDGVVRWKRMFGTDSHRTELGVEFTTNRLLDGEPYSFVREELASSATPYKRIFKNSVNGVEFPVFQQDRYIQRLRGDVKGGEITGFVKRIDLIHQITDTGLKFDDIKIDDDAVSEPGWFDEGVWLTDVDVMAIGINPMTRPVRSFEAEYIHRIVAERKRLESKRKEGLLQKRQDRIDSLKKMRGDGLVVDKTTICRTMVCDDVDPIVDAFVKANEKDIIDGIHKRDDNDPDPIKTFMDEFKRLRRAWFAVTCGQSIAVKCRAAALLYVTMKNLGLTFTQSGIAEHCGCKEVSLRTHYRGITALHIE